MKEWKDSDDMVPGFVQLGVLAVVFQLLIIAGFYGYIRRQRSTEDIESRKSAKRILGSGVGLITLGQLAGVGAVGSLRTAPMVSLRQAILVQNAGLIMTLVGYCIVFGGFVQYSRLDS